MKRLVLIAVFAFIMISVSFAGIKKGQITEDVSLNTHVTLPSITITHTNVINQNIVANANIGSVDVVVGKRVQGGHFPPYYEYIGSTTRYLGSTTQTNIYTILGTPQLIETRQTQEQEGDVIITLSQQIFQRTDTQVNQTITTNYYQTVNQYVQVVDPLVIDLDGNNIPDVPGGTNLAKNTFNKQYAKLFDLNADGVEDFVEWIGPNDGLLIFFENNKYKESVNGFNLMSNAFGYANGFEKLAENFDFNKDNKISGDELENIFIWQDKNQDAKVQKDELLTMKDVGIVEIGTVYGKNSLEGYAKKYDGTVIKIWQWWPSIEWGIGRK